LDAAVKATSRVRSEINPATASTDRMPVDGSNSAQRTTTSRLAAACTHGRMFAS
jgi:hypothetical protein